jgi:hypothetical protein
MALVGGRALQNPKVKKSKSVAKSGRNPKIAANRGTLSKIGFRHFRE